MIDVASLMIKKCKFRWLKLTYTYIGLSKAKSHMSIILPLKLWLQNETKDYVWYVSLCSFIVLARDSFG